LCESVESKSETDPRVSILYSQCHFKHNDEYINQHVGYLSQYAIRIDQHINSDAATVHNRV
jgi:hypothetical protein